MDCQTAWQDARPSPLPQWPHAETEVKVNVCQTAYQFYVSVMTRLVDGDTGKEISAWRRSGDTYSWVRDLKGALPRPEAEGRECYDTDPRHRCSDLELTPKKIEERQKEEERQRQECSSDGCGR